MDKERYAFGQRTLFYIGEELTTFDGFNLDDFMRIICRLLNQQDKEIIKLRQENQQLKQVQKELQISELEKLKNFFLEFYKGTEMDTDFLITKDAGSIADYVLDRIKELKGEIVEKIRNLAEKDFDFDTCTCCGEDVHDDVILTKSDFNKIIDKVLKEYQK